MIAVNLTAYATGEERPFRAALQETKIYAALKAPLFHGTSRVGEDCILPIAGLISPR
jgi:hypothetical protein